MPTTQEIYSSFLSLSENQWLEQVTTDIPFFTVGIVALASVTCLLLAQRLSIPAACILTSAFFAFNGAIFDFVRLLQVAKDTNASNSADSGPFALVVLREISFSLSISLNYLFFLIYLGRPPRGEVKLVGPAERERARRESPSRWSYWGIFGYMAQVALGAAIVAVAVLEVIWRVTEKAKGNVYMADGIIQGVLSISFLGKVLLNTYLSPLVPRWKTARDYSPVISALAIRLGIILASEFCTGFTESPLGRFLQAIQLYVLLVLLLVSPFYGMGGQEEDSPDPRRASSFRGLRFSTVSRWSVINPPNQSGEQVPARGSPSQRLSSWLNTRLATRRDPQEDRLWNKDKPDLEAPPTPGDRNIDDNDASPIEPRMFEKPPQATWQGPYLPDPLSPAGSTSNPTTPSNPGQIVTVTAKVTADSKPLLAPKVPPPNPPNQGGTSGSSSNPNSVSGRFIGKFEINESYESDSDSPIYGINGIIQKKAKRNEKKRRSRFAEDRLSAIDQLKKEQEELEKSVASMAAYSPSKSEFSRKTKSEENSNQLRPDSGAALGTSFLNGGLSESVRSDFSLRDFPSPPGSIFAGSRVKLTESPPKLTDLGAMAEKQSADGLEAVEDVQFAMVPPRMPAVYQRRRASFPAGARESVTSSMDGIPRIISAYADSEDDLGGKRVRMSSANNRLDVTSFIGELTTPQVGRAFVPGRDTMRGRGDSIDVRLSPLPEDISARPSVEIVDMRLKSPTFSPAIAISTSSPGIGKVPKVSFAPVTYDPSGRPKMKATPMLLNTLPASPRPSASPTESPGGAAQFKPVTSSPLANGNFDAAAPGPDRRVKGTYTGSPGSSRPFISGPMPLKGPGEKDYQAPRRAPNPARTQRFL